MSAGPLVVEIICTCLLAAFVLHRYGDIRKQRALVTVATFIAWYFSFMIIFIIPLDVSSTFYRQCLEDHAHTASITPAALSNSTTAEAISTSSNITGALLSVSTVSPANHECVVPTSHVPEHVLPTLWHIVYWTSQVLTWLILPLMQSYSNAGDFTIMGKMKSALIENAIYYGTYLLIFGVCLIYVAARPDLHIDADKLKVIGVTASNTWGLFVLVLMLGYGLVDVPRSLWNNAKRGHQLSKTHFKIAKLSTEKTEAEENLEDVLEEIKRTVESIRYNHPLREYVDKILAKCPESMRHSVRNTDDFEEYDKPHDTPTEKSLVKLHKKLIRCLQIANRTQIQWNNLIQKALDLEDIEANENNPNRYFHRTYGSYSGIFRAIYTPTVEWYWKCRMRTWVMLISSVVLMIFSFMVVWSECLFFVKKPVLSLFAVFIDIAKQHDDYVYIEFASILTIAYLCFCAYYSVFQIRILNYYYIAPHHQTDEYSLIFTGMMLCRLTPPMCLNFLGLIHLDSHVTSVNNKEETSYTKIMGHMDVISFIANGFNIYFPILIVLLCFCTYFSLGSRILCFLGFQQFIGDDEMTQELMDEGAELVRREKRRKERKADGEARRRLWTERFGDRTTSVGTVKDIPRSSDIKSKYMVPRSPDDNDRTELLRQAEPVDYTEDRSDLGGYQSRTQPSQFSSVRSSALPPKGIFDDI